MAFTKEQFEVVTHDGGNLLVSASAGSGKTHTMIERVKRLVIERGVSVNEILAVTFTEAAASDMKEKLKNALSDVVASKKLEKEEKIKWCEKQLDEIGTADISTLHSFCARLIRTYFFTCGISPDFKILDEADASVLRNISIDKTFKELYDNCEDWFLTLIDRHANGRTDKNLKELILSSYAFFDSEAEPFTLAENYQKVYTKENFERLLSTYKNILNQRLLSLINNAKTALNVFAEEKLIKGVEFTKTLIADLETVINTEDFYALKNYADYKLKLDFERKLTETAKEYKELVTSVRAEFIKLMKKFLRCIGNSAKSDYDKFISCKAHTENLVKILRKFSEAYAQEKIEENALDFNDLEHFALKILNDETTREAISSRYKYIFVDEYQDTNGVQEQILARISNNNVFMVGDVKQSIYGFRGCRSEFFTQKDKVMTERGEKVIRLNANFRSAKNVINAVNSIFSFCMTDSVYGESYKERSKLIEGGVYPEGFDGRANLHFLHCNEKKEKIEEKPRIYDIVKETPKVDEGETFRTATLITKIINQELESKIYDTKTEQYRQVQYGDIAILARSKNSKYVTNLVKGLRLCGVPVTAEVTENVCDYPEIKVLVNALKLVDCFLQDLPLASTLKSPIGGFSEEELFEIASFYQNNQPNSYGGFTDAFNYYLSEANTPLVNRLIEFKAYFDGVRLISDFVGARGVLQKLIDDKWLTAYALAQKQGVDKADRIKRLLSATVVNGKTLTVKEFIDRVENCPDAFGISPFAREKTVKVMTIHASKGLEFPVVIACGLERAFNDREDYEEIMLDRENGFAVKYYDDRLRIKEETLLRGVIREKLNVDRMKEEMRLFYVALTRATYSLHMVFSVKEDERKEVFAGANSFLGFIPRYFPAIEHIDVESEFYLRPIEPRRVIIGKPNEELVEKMRKTTNFIYPYQKDTLLPLKASVTAVSTEDGEFAHVLFDEESPDTERGTIAHKLLENYDFLSKDFYLEVQRIIGEGILTEEEVQKINLERIAQAMKCDAFNDLKNKKLYRERAFLVNVEADKIFDTDSKTPVLLQGVIDLLVVDGESAEIIDYKYSSLTKDGLKQKYKKQIELYAYATEKALGKKVVRKTLINIFTGEIVTLS